MNCDDNEWRWRPLLFKYSLNPIVKSFSPEHKNQCMLIAQCSVFPVTQWYVIWISTSSKVTKLKKSESLQTEGHHFRSKICKLSDALSLQILDLKWRPSVWRLSDFFFQKLKQSPEALPLMNAGLKPFLIYYCADQIWAKFSVR